MSSLFELIQFHRCRSVFAPRVVHGLHCDRTESDDLAVHHDPDVFPLERPTQQFGKIATGGSWREG